MKNHKIIDSKELGINLRSKKENELFKWFLACLLFGKPIRQQVAKRTFFEFEKEGLTDPDAILHAGWNKLVRVLDRGRYVRYDYSTATKLLKVMNELEDKYGTMFNMYWQSDNLNDLGSRLQEFKGVGPKTASIFIRDLKHYGWEY